MSAEVPLPAAVAGFREQYRRANIGPGYSGILHWAFTSLGSLAVLGACLLHLREVAPWEWWAVPLTFLFANLVEYTGHRGPMHHPVRGLRILFQRHAQEHHRFYTHEAMQAESTRDFKMVLFPPAMLVFFLGLHAIPVGTLLWFLVSPNVALLFVAVALGYFLTYEWLHLSYHLREDSWIGRRRLVRVLRRLHRTHHDPARMQTHNFNITFPICDALFGTWYRGGAGDARAAANLPPAEGAPR